MRHQVATTIVPLPLAEVETRLRDVESWANFLDGIGSIRCTGHERYVFNLADGRDRREVKVAVKLLYKDHCFVWHGLAGPALRGTLKLAPTGPRHTAVTLSLASYPTDLVSGLAEMLMPRTTTAVLDLQLLEKHLATAAADAAS
jgi:hypothetical protein